jgi:hypothetical protein
MPGLKKRRDDQYKADFRLLLDSLAAWKIPRAPWTRCTTEPLDEEHPPFSTESALLGPPGHVGLRRYQRQVDVILIEAPITQCLTSTGLAFGGL